MATAVPNSEFNGDFANRYSNSRAPSAAAVPSDADAEYESRRAQRILRDSEQQLQDEIRMDPSESVSAWVWGYEDNIAKLQSYVSRNRFAEAKSLFDEMNSVIDENSDEIIRLSKMGEAGPTGAAMAQRAGAILSGAIDRVPVDINGEQTPLGSVLRDGGEFMVGRAKDEFESYGFSSAVGDMYFNGTDSQRKAIASVVDPFVAVARRQGVGAVQNHIQMNELADDIANNWDDLESTFGDGTARFIQHMQSLHQDTGGAADTMRALTTVAKGMGQANGTSGKDLVRDVLGAYMSLGEAVFPPTADGRQAVVTPNQRMTLDSVLVSAVNTANARGLPVDLRSPQFRQAAKEVMGCLAYASSAGIDLLSESHEAGRPIRNAFGDYLANAVAGIDQPSDNVVNSFLGVKSILDNLVVGGRDFASVTSDFTGDPNTYLGSLSRSNDGWSSSNEADGLALGVKQYLLRRITPGIVQGKLPDEALQLAMSGTPSSRAEFMAGMADVFRRSMAGPGSDDASAILAARMTDSILSGRRSSVEDLVSDIIFDPAAQNTPAISTLRNWFNGNVVKQAAYGKKMNECRDHLRNQGLNDLQVSEIMSKVNEQASRAERAGANPFNVYDSLGKVGHYLYPVYAQNADGSVTVDASGEPVVDHIADGIGNLDKVAYAFEGNVFSPGSYSADPAGFQYGQSLLAERRHSQEAARAAAERAAAVQTAREED